jgi:hypothetical protein
MEILVLLDELDDLIRNARPVPLTDQVRLDRDRAFDLIDKLRATIPEEIAAARGQAGPAGGAIDQQELNQAVAEAIRVNAPEIARAVAGAAAPRPPDSPPPGAPF